MIKQKKLKVITSKSKDFSKLKSIRDYLGKKIRSKSGDLAGKVVDVAFSDKKGLEGIIVVNGKLRSFIGKEFFSNVSENTIVLSINPITSIINKKVFDADGRKMGKVIDIEKKKTGNTFNTIIIKNKIYSKSLKIPKKDIAILKKNIILKKVYER